MMIEELKPIEGRSELVLQGYGVANLRKISGQ